MKCPRCNGQMVKHQMHDLSSGHTYIDTHRCLMCGEIMDPVIQVNRVNRPEPPVEPRLRKVRVRK